VGRDEDDEGRGLWGEEWLQRERERKRKAYIQYRRDMRSCHKWPARMTVVDIGGVMTWGVFLQLGNYLPARKKFQCFGREQCRSLTTFCDQRRELNKYSFGFQICTKSAFALNQASAWSLIVDGLLCSVIVDLPGSLASSRATSWKILHHPQVSPLPSPTQTSTPSVQVVACHSPIPLGHAARNHPTP
jgi:hypothetical protein